MLQSLPRADVASLLLPTSLSIFGLVAACFFALVFSLK